jgi:hypothetical protein
MTTYVYAYDIYGSVTYFKCQTNEEHKIRKIAAKKLRIWESDVRIGWWDTSPGIQYHPKKGRIDPKKGDVWVSFTEQ